MDKITQNPTNQSVKQNLHGDKFLNWDSNKKKEFYSLCPKLLYTFNKSLCSKLDDLFLNWPNQEFFLKTKLYGWKEKLPITLTIISFDY